MLTDHILEIVLKNYIEFLRPQHAVYLERLIVEDLIVRDAHGLVDGLKLFSRLWGWHCQMELLYEYRLFCELWVGIRAFRLVLGALELLYLFTEVLKFVSVLLQLLHGSLANFLISPISPDLLFRAHQL